MMDLRGLTSVASILFLAATFSGTASSDDLHPAKLAAVESLRAQLTGVGSGDLNADTVTVQPAAGHLPPVAFAPIPLPRPQPQGTRRVAVPAAKDPIAHRLAIAFAATHPPAAVAQAAPRLPDPATPVGTVFALAYADGSENSGRATPALNAIEALVEKHAEAHDVPPALAHALVQVESSYRPKATGRNGEIGLMQITPKTARAIGYKGSPKGLYDPETNLAWGMKYLAKAQKLAGGDVCGTLLRYNAGLDAKRRSAASSKFCAKVKKVMAQRA